MRTKGVLLYLHQDLDSYQFLFWFSYQNLVTFKVKLQLEHNAKKWNYLILFFCE